MSVFSLLDKERIVAPPGYSRWLIPPAALCVHLCIGQVYAFSVFNLPMTKLIGITQSAPGDWKLTELGWIFSLAIFFLGASAAVLGRWVEEGGPRKAMFAVGPMFWRRIPDLGVRHLPPQSAGHLSRLRRARRHRPRHRLHLAGLDPDQVVSRPARHGDRDGDHGVRRRRLHRRTAFGLADGQVLDADPCRRCRDLHRHGANLSLLHDGRRRHRPRSAAGLGARGLCCSGAAQAAR